MEHSIRNDGSAQPRVDQTTSKYSVYATSCGSQPATAAFYATGGGKFYKGIMMRQDEFAPYAEGSFVELQKAGAHDQWWFRVDSNGMLTHVNGRAVVVRNIGGYDCLTLL